MTDHENISFIGKDKCFATTDLSYHKKDKNRTNFQTFINNRFLGGIRIKKLANSDIKSVWPEVNHHRFKPNIETSICDHLGVRKHFVLKYR